MTEEFRRFEQSGNKQEQATLDFFARGFAAKRKQFQRSNQAEAPEVNEEDREKARRQLEGMRSNLDSDAFAFHLEAGERSEHLAEKLDSTAQEYKKAYDVLASETTANFAQDICLQVNEQSQVHNTLRNNIPLDGGLILIQAYAIVISQEFARTKDGNRRDALRKFLTTATAIYEGEQTAATENLTNTQESDGKKIEQIRRELQ